MAATTGAPIARQATTWPPGTTILELLDQRLAGDHDRVALRTRNGHDGWSATTWATYGRLITEVAAGLESGVSPGDRVAILSWNRAEWQEADLGTLSLGAISVPVYPTSASPQVGYVLAHSASRVCFVEDSEQLGRVLEQRAQLPVLEHIVVFDGRTLDGVALDDPVVLLFDELRALGVRALAHDPALVERAAHGDARRRRDHRLYERHDRTAERRGSHPREHHGNAAVGDRGRAALIRRPVPLLPPAQPHHRAIGVPPRTARGGGRTWFARSISTVGQDLPECRPTVFLAVPRVWEKIREGVEARVAQLRGLQGRAARVYLSLAGVYTRELEEGQRVSRTSKLAWRALDVIVGTSLRRQIGLDRARIIISGAAPIHPDLIRWFHGIGLPLAEGYGQTEVALATTLNPPGASRIGTVGPPLPGVSVRIAADDEILVKGDNVCQGYWHDDAATHELIDDDGWLHSGDLGAFDDRGYLCITGRKKDLIITAHGKNISPQSIETDLAGHPLIGQAVVIGDGRRYLTALLALDEDTVESWARTHGRGTVGLEAISRDPDLHDELSAAVEAVNALHAHVEHIRNWRVLPRTLTVADGELTPTLKVKRAAVNERYNDLIADMYAEPTPTIAG